MISTLRFLQLNIGKTKEIIIEFRKKDVTPPPAMIKGSEVQRLTEYTYLGVILVTKLSWSNNIDYIIKKLNTRLYCMRKLHSFKVDKLMLCTFYNFVVSSVWKY